MTMTTLVYHLILYTIPRYTIAGSAEHLVWYPPQPSTTDVYKMYTYIY